MCGVAGISAPSVAEADIRAMTAAIRHRGPDGEGTWLSPDGTCGLGHTRLAIQDVSDAGAQPMHSHNGRFQLSYNGEIYNVGDLRRELEAAHGVIPWRGHSDSEILIEGVAREGLAFLERLNGIFAILIYDTSERVLHALRDPLGVKPMFIARTGQTLALGSEIKCFDSLDGIDRRLRLASIADQLALMYVPEPHTLFEGISKLPPGVLVSWRHGEKVAEREMFSGLIGLPDATDLRSDEEWIEDFEAAFSAAVKRQTISDVPVGLMLSGGLDSSAVAHALRDSGAKIREAFTIAVSDQDRRLDGQSDDLKYARKIADQYGIHLNIIEARSDFVTDFGKLVHFFEDGYSDPAAISTWLISEAARKAGIKVLLTGQGADEFLCGYRRYAAAPVLMRLPEATAPLTRMLGRLLPGQIAGPLNPVLRRIRRLLSVASQPRAARLRSLYSWASPDTVRDMLANPGNLVPLAELTAMLERPEGAGLIDRMSHTDINYDLRSLNLTYCDRMSMAAGVEARVPFLDFDLVRLMSRIPARMKQRDTTSKFVLKKAMEGKLPNDVIYREKAGFSLPIRAWLTRSEIDLADVFDPEALRRQGIFNPTWWQQAFQAYAEGRDDLVYPIYSFYCLQILLRARGI